MFLNKISEFFSMIRILMTYRVWKNKIMNYLDYNKHSEFCLLDVGCGCGNFLKCISKWFSNCSLYGLDISNSALEAAKKNVDADLILHDAKQLPFSNSMFDIICCHHVIEHLENPCLFFEEAKRILKQNGLFIISTPNPSGICAKIHKGKWMSFIKEHVSLKDPDSWRKALQEQGFEILEDGTTALSGLKLLHLFPLSLFNWIPLSIFGFFHWYKGEAYMAIARKI